MTTWPVCSWFMPALLLLLPHEQPQRRLCCTHWSACSKQDITDNRHASPMTAAVLHARGCSCGLEAVFTACKDVKPMHAKGRSP